MSSLVIPGEEKQDYKTECRVCAHRCRLSEGQTGICRARTCRKGEIVSISYGRLTALALDPIEKKPLKRFYPGSRILSAGSFGCNLSCPFCQNYEISTAGLRQVQWRQTEPEELVELALEMRPKGNIGLAFTYNEPLIGYEFVRDCARLAQQKGLKSVAVTNGSVSPEILEEILPCIDAFNVDLKGFTEAFYEKINGNLEIVKEFIRKASERSHVEVTTLVIPGENDTEEEIRELAAWLGAVSPDIPLHLSRFFPRFHMKDRKATEVSKIYRLAEAAGQYLKYVYPGNCQGGV